MTIETGPAHRWQFGTKHSVMVNGAVVGMVEPSRSGQWTGIPVDGDTRHGFASADEAATYVAEENARAQEEIAAFKARRAARNA